MQEELVRVMRLPAFYGNGVESVEHIETHISHVFLAGSCAYKVKKAVDLGFLNFKTLEARRFYCEEELRLNRRLAPALYLGVVAITGTPQRPVLEGEGAALEYAVKMRRFPRDALLGDVLARGELAAAQVDDIADQVAAFHASVPPGLRDSAWGSPGSVCVPALENFRQLRALPEAAAGLDELERWTVDQCRDLAGEMRDRNRGGFVRECHGDLHLDNMALVDGRITVFDCVEFNPELRWIDVINEAAFLVMDMKFRNCPNLAHRFINRYLERAGDYGGLRMLRFYTVYRALVRAKVEGLRINQPDAGADEKAGLHERFQRHVALAGTEIIESCPVMLLTHGPSGSGKTTVTQPLLEAIGAIRIRSDLERKRLHGFDPLARTGSGVDAGLYSADATRRTYDRLRELARVITSAGYSVIVDATFLKRVHRDAMRGLARELNVPLRILGFSEDEETMRARIRERNKMNDDASEADVEVLQRQLRSREPLQADELPAVVHCAPGRSTDDVAAELVLDGATGSS